MYDALGVKNVNAILPPPAKPMPMDPALENIMAMSQKPFQAFPGQDHKAHIDAHLNFMRLNMVQNNPMVMAAMQKNILEHISLMAQEQVQIEFIEELQELQMMQQQQRVQQITNGIEARKAQLIAEMQEDYAKEEEKITGEFAGDPLLKIKSREVDLKAAENQRREEEGQERLNLDKMKAMMNQSQHEDDLEQSKDLAEMRANVSLTKQEMSDASKRHDFGRNFRKN
tara:strand:- start:192 stop:872 length:681 start_codon:yes stop_codon:yes gene_type:complete